MAKQQPKTLVRHQDELDKIIDPNENWDDQSCPYATAASELPQSEPIYDTSETWDCRLSHPDNQDIEFRKLLDPDFQSRLNFKNPFQTCTHDLVKVICPCPNQQQMQVCRKCYSVFCNEACMRFEDGWSSSAARNSQVPSSAPSSSQSRARTSQPNFDEPDRPIFRPAYGRSDFHSNRNRNQRGFNPQRASLIEAGGAAESHVTSNYQSANSAHLNSKICSGPSNSGNKSQSQQIIGPIYDQSQGVPIASCYSTIDTSGRYSRAPAPQNFSPTSSENQKFSPKPPVSQNLSQKPPAPRNFPPRPQPPQNLTLRQPAPAAYPVHSPIQNHPRSPPQILSPNSAQSLLGNPPPSLGLARFPLPGSMLSPNSAQSLLGNPPPDLPRLPLPVSPRSTNQKSYGSPSSPAKPVDVNQKKGILGAQKVLTPRSPPVHEKPSTSTAQSKHVAPRPEHKTQENSVALQKALPLQPGSPIVDKVGEQKLNSPTLNTVQNPSVVTKGSPLVAATRCLPLKMGEGFAAGCCWVGSPWDLGFNVIEEVDYCDSVCEIPFDKNWRRLSHPRVGDLCMAPYAGSDLELDESRYRGKIVHDGSVTLDASVLFIDFGNVAQVPKKDLRMMPADLLQVPAFARRLKIANVEPLPGSDWTLQVKMQLESLIMGKPIEVVLLSRDEKEDDLFWGSVSYKGKDVGEYLVKNGVAQKRSIPKAEPVPSTSRDTASGSGLATVAPVQRVDALQKKNGVELPRKLLPTVTYYLGPSQPIASEPIRELASDRPLLPLNEMCKVTVSHVTDLNNFYVVREDDVVKRRKLNENLASAADFVLDTYNPSVHHSLIVTINTVEYKWVRGLLWDMEDGGCWVQLLDYGGFRVVTPEELKVPPKHAFSIPPYAYHCSMDVLPCQLEVEGDVVNGSGWDERIITKLKNVGNEPGLSAKCIETKNDMSLIELWPDGCVEAWGSSLVKVGLATWMYPPLDSISDEGRT